MFTITSHRTYVRFLNPMEECFSVNKSRAKNSLTSTWRTAPHRLLAERMTVVVLEVSWTPFGSWCRVQPPRLWLTSNSDTTWLDCSWHNKGNLSLPKTPIAFPPGPATDQSSPQLSLTTLCGIVASLMTLRCWPLLPVSWRLRQGPTKFPQPWWGGQMGNSSTWLHVYS